MSIKKFFASKDNTITNAFKENLVSSVSLSNMGQSDILEVFSIYAQASTSSVEKSRILVEFPISELISERSAGLIPSSGSVSFKLKLFNASHSETLPKQYNIASYAISKEWTEGLGLDMENYTDLDASNWVSASHSVKWTTEGGDFITGSYVKKTYFEKGDEDLEVDITDLVEAWVTGSTANNGILLKLSGSFEDGSLQRSHYTKRFFARGSQFFYKRPVIEAQWDASTQHTASLPANYSQSDEYVFNITNLKKEYKNYEKANLKVYTRNKKWQPNIYTKASEHAPVDIVDEAYYKVTRVADGLDIIPYSHDKSPSFSKMSYNSSGSYFDLDFSLFEPNYLYEISFLRKTGSICIEQEEKFRFRVE